MKTKKDLLQVQKKGKQAEIIIAEHPRKFILLKGYKIVGIERIQIFVLLKIFYLYMLSPFASKTIESIFKLFFCDYILREKIFS